MRKLDTAAGMPAVTLPGIVTDLDRQIVARCEAGETRKAICEAFGIKVSRVYHAEYVCRRDAEGRKILAKCADSIEGLEAIGGLDGAASNALTCHHWHHDGPSPERMSEVAALGRAYVSRMHGIGPKSLASIDRVLALLGIAWSPIERTPKPKQQQPIQPAQSAEPGYWADIVSHVSEIERSVGSSVLAGHPNRDSEQGIALRLAFLNGYMESMMARSRNIIDVTPDDQDEGEDLETAGNLVCLPGVKLSDVLPQDDGGAS